MILLVRVFILFSFLFISHHNTFLFASEGESSLESGSFIIRQSKENYLKEHQDDAFLLIGCGHFTPNDSHVGSHPCYDKDGNKIGEITTNYYSSNFWGDYSFHEHPGTYTVNVDADLNSDIVGAIGNPKVDNYLFCDPVWKIIFPENTSFLLTETFLKNVAQGLCEGGVFITEFADFKSYPFLQEKNHLFKNLSRADSETVLKNIFKEYGFSDVKLYFSLSVPTQNILQNIFSKKFEGDDEKEKAAQDFCDTVFTLKIGEETMEFSFPEGIKTVNPEASAYHSFFNYTLFYPQYLIAKK
jgi:hypothetical protein